MWQLRWGRKGTVEGLSVRKELNFGARALLCVVLVAFTARSIQSAYRALVARVGIDRLKASATLIQATWRGHAVRARFAVWAAGQ